jgi:hypothetical protein
MHRWRMHYNFDVFIEPFIVRTGQQYWRRRRPARRVACRERYYRRRSGDPAVCHFRGRRAVPAWDGCVFAGYVLVAAWATRRAAASGDDDQFSHGA